MLMQSQTLFKKGKWIELENLLNRIVSEYPKTKAARAATEMLDKMVKNANSIAEITLKSAYVASVGYLASYPNEEID